jgi:hypothetical protein
MHCYSWMPIIWHLLHIFGPIIWHLLHIFGPIIWHLSHIFGPIIWHLSHIFGPLECRVMLGLVFLKSSDQVNFGTCFAKISNLMLSCTFLWHNTNCVQHWPCTIYFFGAFNESFMLVFYMPIYRCAKFRWKITKNKIRHFLSGPQNLFHNRPLWRIFFNYSMDSIETLKFSLVKRLDSTNTYHSEQWFGLFKSKWNCHSCITVTPEHLFRVTLSCIYHHFRPKCDRLWENQANVTRQNSEKRGKSKKKYYFFSKDAPLIHFIHPNVQKYVQKCLKIAPNVIKINIIPI